MIILITAAIGLVILVSSVAGYRIGTVKTREPLIDYSNESSPIYDQMVSDYPETYLKLISPVTTKVVSHV